HFVQIRGTSYDTAGHNADWKHFVDVTSNAGASTWTLQSRIDAASFATRFSVTDGGAISVGDAPTTRTNLGLAIGTNVEAFDADLDALAALASNGMIARTGAGTVSARTITGTTNQISVSNGDGVSGNPT